jgi:hypothetical protein
MYAQGLRDTDGWTAEAVDFDPFAGVPDQAGRIAMADGGFLEPVDGDPFAGLTPESPGSMPAPDRTMQPTDIARAKGFPEPRSPMHDRIAAASQGEPEEPARTLPAMSRRRRFPVR